MTEQERANASKIMLQVISSLQSDKDSWVDLASIGAPLTAKGIQYKELGFLKLRLFLNNFEDVLEFDEKLVEGKPPVCYVRPKYYTESSNLDMYEVVEDTNTNSITCTDNSKMMPSKDSQLFTWAWIPPSSINALAKLALEERWYYGDHPSDQENLPILRNYLKYTFKRLSFERKVQIIKEDESNKEYAAFNTGLVDRKYEYIYALFDQNKNPGQQYWHLLSFVVPGENAGKTLVRLFNPLPQRANYFENKIQNMLYDTSTGALRLDCEHIITERTERLPIEFLKENCNSNDGDFLLIDGVGIDDICHKPEGDETRKKYFEKLGKKICDNDKIYRRVTERIKDATKLALKKVEWNYKTAIPMYFPTRNTCSLLLPLALMDEVHIDLALVVERTQSGAYIGQTILPLNLAYSNSRLVARPDSDWLRTDVIGTTAEDFDDNE